MEKQGKTIKNNKTPYNLIYLYGVVMKSLQSLALARKALTLMADKAKTKTTIAILRWNKEALTLFGNLLMLRG